MRARIGRVDSMYLELYRADVVWLGGAGSLERDPVHVHLLDERAIIVQLSRNSSTRRGAEGKRLVHEWRLAIHERRDEIHELQRVVSALPVFA